MYLVIEFQYTGEHIAIPAPTEHTTINDANQKWHQIMAAAAVSNVPKHGALIIDETGLVIRRECYEHPAQ